MEIYSLQKNECGLYLNKLNEFIKETINLPSAAIDYYLNQWTEEKLQKNLDNFVFLVAKKNDKIVGLVLGTPCEGGVGTIVWVLVNPKFHKQGIGKSLFNYACKVYKNKKAHKIKLTVPDLETVEFYKKQGMHLEGEHPNHWWGNKFWSMGINI